MPDLDTAEWKIAATIEYVPKVNGIYKDCTACCGNGRPNGGFGSFAEDEDCPKCFGRGKIWQPTYPTEPKPDLPQALIDHMRHAYLEYKLKQP